jgi:hypothetical protein
MYGFQNKKPSPNFGEGFLLFVAPKLLLSNRTKVKLRELYTLRDIIPIHTTKTNKQQGLLEIVEKQYTSYKGIQP